MTDPLRRRAQLALELLRVLGGGEIPPLPPDRRLPLEPREIGEASEVAEHSEAVSVAHGHLAAICDGLAARLREPGAWCSVGADGELSIDCTDLRQHSAECAALARAASPEIARNEPPAARHVRRQLEYASNLATRLAFAPYDLLRPLYVGPLERFTSLHDRRAAGVAEAILEAHAEHRGRLQAHYPHPCAPGCSCGRPWERPGGGA